MEANQEPRGARLDVLLSVGVSGIVVWREGDVASLHAVTQAVLAPQR